MLGDCAATPADGMAKIDSLSNIFAALNISGCLDAVDWEVAHPMKRLWKSDRSRSYTTSDWLFIWWDTPPTHIDEFLLLLVVSPSRLILKNHVIVPSALDIEVCLWIQ